MGVVEADGVVGELGGAGLEAAGAPQAAAGRGILAPADLLGQVGGTSLRSRGSASTAATGFDYLRLLAVSRIYLDNVPSIQTSWVTQGLKMGQVALAFGANDMGSTMIEENVVAAAGVRNQCDVDEMVRLIRAAGRTPLQRDTLYGEVRRY
jgi:2-iminoacetate synthase ThiH